MGHGIAQLLAMTGTDVTLVDISDDILAKAREKIQWSIQKFVEKRTIRKEDADAALARLHTTTNMDEAFKNADLIDSVFGPGKSRYVPGHEEIEIGLVKLHRATGDKRYRSHRPGELRRL